ncbi:MAG: hypothetical protein V7750_04025 [Sneathiella sp.]
MSSNSKFLFDNEFGEASVPSSKKKDAPPPPPPALYTEEDKVSLCEAARQQGFAEGQSTALTGIEASVTQTLEALKGQLQLLSNDHNSSLENIRCEAASLAMSIANKLAPALIARLPEAEVLKLVEECLNDLHDEPRIVVRASEPVCSAISDKIDRLAEATGFQGRIILLPDDTKSGSDCRIEWADGGAEKDLKNTSEKMDEIINRFVRSSFEVG